MAEGPGRVLTEDECWQKLGAHELGRLAFTIVDEQHILPVNYVVDGPCLLFRSAPGSKLFGAALGSQVALEIDEIGASSAWSVVARGIPRILPEDEEYRADVLDLRSWVATPKFLVVEIVVEEVSGRAYHLYRPGERMAPL